jgi:hypothetical protein
VTGGGGPIAFVGDSDFALALVGVLLRRSPPDGAAWRVAVRSDRPDAAHAMAERLGTDARGVTIEVHPLAHPVPNDSQCVFVSQVGDDDTIGSALQVLRTVACPVVACLRRAAPFAAAQERPGCR